MSRFDLTVKYSLNGLADGWTDEHYLTFKAFEGKDSLDAGDEIKTVDEGDERGYEKVFTKYLKQQFIGGKVLVNGETVDAEEEDIGYLPNSAKTEMFLLVSRSRFSDPKALR